VICGCIIIVVNWVNGFSIGLRVVCSTKLVVRMLYYYGWLVVVVRMVMVSILVVMMCMVMLLMVWGKWNGFMVFFWIWLIFLGKCRF